MTNEQKQNLGHDATLFRNQTYNKPQIYRMWSNKPKRSFISSPQNG